MHEEAIAWAAAALGATVHHVEQLEGGRTSTMLALSHGSGSPAVLRLMTEEPWRSHGPALTTREQATQRALLGTPVPAPRSLALDAEGRHTGVSAHLMSLLPGRRAASMPPASISAMAEALATIHDVRPADPFRTYQSWAWEAKWVVPAWTRHPESWQRAFEVLAQEPPPYEPTFLHRDFGHHNLLWEGGAICGVVDWVETSTGPAWLDAGHAATNLAVAFGVEAARSFLDAYAATTGRRPDPYWLVMDAVGFLPPPGKELMFGSTAERAGLDAWLDDLVQGLAP